MRPNLRSLVFACFGVALSAASVQAADYEIKLSVLAPEGSTWVKEMEAMNQELQAKSGGKLALKIYAGGVSGAQHPNLRHGHGVSRRLPERRARRPSDQRTALAAGHVGDAVREGSFREMKRHVHYEKPSEKRARQKAEAVRRARKLARKRAQREGLIAAPKKPAR